MNQIVVTGINGFVGKYLASELCSNSIRVTGIGMDDTIKVTTGASVSEYYRADLTSGWPRLEQVDAVIHLAGLAAVGPSFDNPQAYITVNSTLITNMCEYYLKQENKPRIIVVSSGAIYDSNQEMPHAEYSALGFHSPYAVSKVLVENQCAYYRNRGLDCIVVRPFNHIGPGQRPGFLLPDLYEQLLEAKHSKTPIKVGNLKTRRDYTDVRDVVRAYRLLATAKTLPNFIYNVCSGSSTSGEAILRLLQEESGTHDVAVSVDKSKIRPTDPLDIIGDNTRLKEDTGWEPRFDLKQTIADFVQSRQ